MFQSRLRVVVPFAALVLVFGSALYACGDNARAVSSCQRLEADRCNRLAKDDCKGTAFYVSDPAACGRFYQLQCGRGVAPTYQEPTAPQLDKCERAIASSCSIAADPLSDLSCSSFIDTTYEAGVDAAEAGDAAETSDAEETMMSSDTGTMAVDTGTMAVDSGTTSDADAGDTIGDAVGE